jgi:hypothetical protein
LIQILCIKEPAPAGAAFAAAKARAVNRARGVPERQMAASGRANTTSKLGKNRESGAVALYRAVTLSLVMARAWQSA